MAPALWRIQRMTKYTRYFGAPLALGATLLTAACAKSADNAALATDTAAVNRDLNLARADSAQPALNDVPATATPTPAATPAPAPRPTTTSSRTTTTPRATTTTTKTTTTTPKPNTTASGNTVTSGTSGSGAAGGGASGTLASGTTIDLTSDSRLCTNTQKVGDHFTATVSHAVTSANGISIPAGARASGSIVALKRSENANDNIIVQVSINSISYNGHSFPVDAATDFTKVEKVRNEPKAKDAQKVAVGAAAGAILGQVLGKNTKGTVIGAAAGAAAGAGVAAGTANYEGCVPDGGQITIKLNSPLNIRA
jgi:hypothetical protein